MWTDYELRRMPPTATANHRCVQRAQMKFEKEGTFEFCTCTRTDCPVNEKMIQWIAAIYWFTVQYAKITGRQYDVAAFIPVDQIQCFTDNHCIRNEIKVKGNTMVIYKPKVYFLLIKE